MIKKASAGILSFLTLVLSLALASPGIAFASDADDAANIYNSTNSARQNNGLNGLTRNGSLDSVAYNWAVSMSQNNNFAHNPSTGSQIPSGWSKWGENIAWVMGSSSSAMFDNWMNSSGHYANIMGDFTDIGVAYYTDSSGKSWGVQVFAKYSPAVVTPEPPVTPPAPPVTPPTPPVTSTPTNPPTTSSPSPSNPTIPVKPSTPGTPSTSNTTPNTPSSSNSNSNVPTPYSTPEARATEAISTQAIANDDNGATFKKLEFLSTSEEPTTEIYNKYNSPETISVTTASGDVITINKKPSDPIHISIGLGVIVLGCIITIFFMRRNNMKAAKKDA